MAAGEIAYLCISMERRKPPKRGAIKKMIFEAMANQLSSLERFIIPLEEIKRATDSFNEKNLIGVGTYGKVYRGQLSERWQNCTTAIKCLEVRDDQGMVEFHRELRRISNFHHENIISFIGYCDEEKQMIIVSEYASNGSLSDHLEDEDKMSCITWAQRLKICLGIARGLNYLHSGRGEHNRVKSGNILLDENLEAKICDFGFSKSATVDTQVVRGTPLYLDPIYSETGILPKELDIFSFGVILFEILSGTPVYGSKSYGNVMHQHLISLVRLKMVDRPEALIDPHIKDAVDTRSTVIITEIVYLCISMELEERPSTGFITDRINEALKIQETIPVLTECLIKDVGFSQGKPVAAFTIHKCLLHWKSFETEGTIVFDRLVNMFDLAIEKEDSNSHMAYWLSNLSALLCLIQGSLISDESGSMVATAIEVVQAVPKHTALSFKHKLAEDVEYLYDIIRGNLIKELGTSLTLCIQAPRTTPRRVLAGGLSIGKDHESNHWQRIVDCLNALHNTMKENF